MRIARTLILCFVSFQPALAETRTVSVFGRSTTDVVPDVATIDFGVVTQGRELTKVKEATNQSISNIRQSLRKLGIPEKAVSTSQIELTVRSQSKSKDEGMRFEMYRQVRVRLEDLSMLGKVIDGAIAAGCNRIRGIRYSSSQADQIMKKLLQEAIADAKEQAEQLAEGFNTRLGSVVSIRSDRGGGSIDDLSLVISTKSDPFDGESYRPGVMEFERSVSAVFELTY